MAEQYPFEVHAPSLGREDKFTATVRIKVESPDKQSGVLHYIRSIQIKQDFMNGWIKDNAPGYGLEIVGGPRPVFKDPGDRQSPVIAYEQDFKVCRPV